MDEYAIHRGHRAEALASLAAHLDCTIREAEQHLRDGTAAEEIRRTQPPRRGIDGHLAYALIMRR